MAKAAVVLLMLFGAGLDYDDPREALREARELKAQGKYAEALERHIWFHDHALEKQPALYGVRLSFALLYWVELGKKYPNALVKLKTIRDVKTIRLVGGESDQRLFHDVVSINMHLDEDFETISLFKDIEEHDPDFAMSVYSIADEAIIKAKEYTLARKYFASDPMQELLRMKSEFQTMVDTAEQADSTSGLDLRNTFNRIYSDKVIRLMTVLANTGDETLAGKIQKEALTFLKSDQLKRIKISELVDKEKEE